MKKLFTYLFLILFSFQASSQADDIRDFQIEGMSVGDSALDYFSEENINNVSKTTYPSSDKFYAISILDNTNGISFNSYEWVKMHFKKNDKNYTIFSIGGGIDYPNNFQNCRKEQKKIVNKIKDTFSLNNPKTYTNNFGGKGGKSIAYVTDFNISGDGIRVWCTKWDKKNKYTKNWVDALNVAAETKELLDWLTNEYFKQILKKINNCENIIISTNFEEPCYAYKLCANADLVIAKHNSLADECLANEIPVLIHDYNHNQTKIFSKAFNYLSSRIMCNNFEELLERSKSLLFDNSSKLKDEIAVLNKKIYHVKEKGNVKNKIIRQLENLINRTQK